MFQRIFGLGNYITHFRLQFNLFYINGHITHSAQKHYEIRFLNLQFKEGP